MKDYGAIDDAHVIKESEVPRIVRSLCIPYTGIRRSFFAKYVELSELFNEGKMVEFVKLFATIFELPQGFIKKIGYSTTIKNRQFNGAFAGILQAFNRTDGELVAGILLFRDSKEAICKCPEQLILHTVAHELSHVRLALDKHTLVRSEFAADVLAVIVTGSPERYLECIAKPGCRYGYIRPELYKVFFTSFVRQVDTIYL